MLKILGGLFAARQRGVEDGAPALIKRPCRSELDSRSFDLDLVFDLRAPSSRLSRRRGTDWGMLSIIGGPFAARQRGIEDGAEVPPGFRGHALAVQDGCAIHSGQKFRTCSQEDESDDTEASCG